MSPGHFRIPGHSGTDQKHKKALAKLRKHATQRRHSWEAGERTVNRTADRSGRVSWAERQRRLIGLVLIPLCLVALSGLVWLGDGIFTAYVRSSPPVPTTGGISFNAYRVLTKTGEAHLYRYAGHRPAGPCRAGDLATARREFELALRSCAGCPEATRGLQHVVLLEELE